MTPTEKKVLETTERLARDMEALYSRIFYGYPEVAQMDNQFYYDSANNPGRRFEIELGVMGSVFPLKLEIMLSQIKLNAPKNPIAWEVCWKLYEPYGNFGQSSTLNDCYISREKGKAVDWIVNQYKEMLERRDKLARQAKAAR